jgi:hypothetical protein
MEQSRDEYPPAAPDAVIEGADLTLKIVSPGL